MNDRIEIIDQEVHCHIGVPEEERATPQRLLISSKLFLNLSEAGQKDDIAQTIDYFQVYQRIHDLAAARERQLIETLAEEIAEMVLVDFQPDSVEIKIKKFILPNTQHVSVCIQRSRGS